MPEPADARVDVGEDLLRLPDVSQVVIVADDSDYIALAQRCKKLGRYVIGVGVAGSTSKFLASACDQFVDYDALPAVTELQESEAPTPATKKNATAPTSPTSAAPKEVAAPESAASAPVTRAAAAHRPTHRPKASVQGIGTRLQKLHRNRKVTKQRDRAQRKGPCPLDPSPSLGDLRQIVSATNHSAGTSRTDRAHPF